MSGRRNPVASAVRPMVVPSGKVYRRERDVLTEADDLPPSNAATEKARLDAAVAAQSLQNIADHHHDVHERLHGGSVSIINVYGDDLGRIGDIATGADAYRGIRWEHDDAGVVVTLAFEKEYRGKDDDL